MWEWLHETDCQWQIAAIWSSQQSLADDSGTAFYLLQNTHFIIHYSLAWVPTGRSETNTIPPKWDCVCLWANKVSRFCEEKKRSSGKLNFGAFLLLSSVCFHLIIHICYKWSLFKEKYSFNVCMNHRHFETSHNPSIGNMFVIRGVGAELIKHGPLISHTL